MSSAVSPCALLRESLEIRGDVTTRPAGMSQRHLDHFDAEERKFGSFPEKGSRTPKARGRPHTRAGDVDVNVGWILGSTSSYACVIHAGLNVPTFSVGYIADSKMQYHQSILLQSPSHLGAAVDSGSQILADTNSRFR